MNIWRVSTILLSLALVYVGSVVAFQSRDRYIEKTKLHQLYKSVDQLSAVVKSILTGMSDEEIKRIVSNVDTNAYQPKAGETSFSGIVVTVNSDGKVSDVDMSFHQNLIPK